MGTHPGQLLLRAGLAVGWSDSGFCCAKPAPPFIYYSVAFVHIISVVLVQVLVSSNIFKRLEFQNLKGIGFFIFKIKLLTIIIPDSTCTCHELA